MEIFYILITIVAIVYFIKYIKNEKKKKLEKIQNINAAKNYENIIVDPQLKKCPFCFEEINSEAKKCKHCGEYLDVDLRLQNEKNKAKSQIKYRMEITPALLIIIGFFLPWLSVLGLNFSGFELPNLASKANTISNIFAETTSDYSSLIYLVPILCVLTIISAITNKLLGLTSLITSIFSFIVSLYCFYLFAIQGDIHHWMFENIGIGIWITFIGSFMLLVLGLIEFISSIYQLLKKIGNRIINKKNLQKDQS